jgi:hypothetical protein
MNKQIIYILVFNPKVKLNEHRLVDSANDFKHLYKIELNRLLTFLNTTEEEFFFKIEKWLEKGYILTDNFWNQLIENGTFSYFSDKDEELLDVYNIPYLQLESGEYQPYVHCHK